MVHYSEMGHGTLSNDNISSEDDWDNNSGGMTFLIIIGTVVITSLMGLILFDSKRVFVT